MSVYRCTRCGRLASDVAVLTCQKCRRSRAAGRITALPHIDEPANSSQYAAQPRQGRR